MPRTTTDHRWMVISLKEAGFSSRAIFTLLGIPKSTVFGILNRHLTRPHEVSDLHRSGRPCETPPREGQRLPELHWKIDSPLPWDFIRRWNLVFLITKMLTLSLQWCPSLADYEPWYQHHWESLVPNITGKNGMDLIPKTAVELRTAVRDAWARVLQAYIRRLVVSIPRRLRGGVEAEGRHVHY